MTKLMHLEQFEALCEYISSRISGPQDCDNKLTLTTQWLTDNGFHVEANCIRLNALGGYCDCEVLMNAEGRWTDEEEPPARELWLEFLVDGRCGLCGNLGVIDTTATIEGGGKFYCICPNGRAAKLDRTDKNDLLDFRP